MVRNNPVDDAQGSLVTRTQQSLCAAVPRLHIYNRIYGY